LKNEFEKLIKKYKRGFLNYNQVMFRVNKLRIKANKTGQGMELQRLLMDFVGVLRRKND